MALNANAILTLDDAKERLFEKSEENDPIIEKMIDHFTGLIENEIGTFAVQRTLTDERVDGTGTAEILLPWPPIVSITSFKINDDGDDTTCETITDSTKWIEKDLNAGLIRLTESAFIRGTRNILFTGDVGFVSTGLDFRNLEEAAYIMLDDYYRRWERREIAVVQKSYPDGTATYIPAAPIPPLARNILLDHRLRHL